MDRDFTAFPAADFISSIFRVTASAVCVILKVTAAGPGQKGEKMNLLNMLLGTLTSGNSVNALSEKTGANSSQITKLIMIALPLIIKALTKNTSSSSGASSLLGALTQHTSRDAIDKQITNADTADGAAILNHILGGNTASVTNGLAEQTGLSGNQVSTALNSIAPAILSGLSAATTQAQTAAAQAQQNTGAVGGVDLSDGLDLSDIMGMFMGGQAQSSQAQGGLGGGLLSGLLGSFLGGQKEEPQAQQAVTGSSAMNLLSGLMGSGNAGGLSDLLGNTDDEASFNGSSLLSALLGGR